MIRINLLRGAGPAGRSGPDKALVSRREAITGGVLLTAAVAILLYLAARPGAEAPKALKSEPAATGKVVAPAPAPESETSPPAATTEPPPQVEPPAPEPKATTQASPPKVETPVAPPQTQVPAPAPKLAPAASPPKAEKSVAPPQTQAPAAAPKLAPATSPPKVETPVARPQTQAPAAAPKAATPASPPKVERPAAVGPTPASPPATTASGCLVTELAVAKGPLGLTVSLRGTSELHYTSFELTQPDRIVIDVRGCRGALPRGQASQAIEHPAVQRVRTNQFQTDPDVFRVVLDAVSKPRYQIRGTSNGLELRLLDGKP